MAKRLEVLRQAVAWMEADHPQGAEDAAEEMAAHFSRREEHDSAAYWRQVAAAITDIRTAPAGYSEAVH